MIKEGARALFQAGAHSLIGGLMAKMQGGNFNQGALAGGFLSVTGSAIGNIFKGKGAGLAQWFGGGLSGGVGSVIAGGSFWDGARQGLITGGLNHAAHSLTNLDIIVTSDPDAAGNMGHQAALIEIHEGENKGKWQYYSKDGYKDGVGNKIYNSPEQFFSENPRYKLSMRFKTNSTQDKAALKEMKIAVNTRYSVVGSNCYDAVRTALSAAGIWSAWSLIPNNAFIRNSLHHNVGVKSHW